MSDIKKYFESRWPLGYIVEMDFSQLEVIVLAYLSQDKQLIDDILSGRDMHCVRAAELYGVSEALFVREYLAGDKAREAQRKLAKAFSFQLQYGAGPTSMAKSNNVSVKIAKEFIENYYNRYPRIKEWQDELAAEVQMTRRLTKAHTATGFPAGQGFHRSETGRIYVFNEYDNDYKPGHTRFSSTQMKNYPVQGLATADIVPMILGKIYRRIKTEVDLHNRFLMINTIHDSIIFDVSDKGTLDKGVPIIKEVMENAPKYLKSQFGMDFNLPLKVDVEYGKNWLEMEKYET